MNTTIDFKTAKTIDSMSQQISHILLVAEFICFVLFFGATAITEDIGRFSEWLAEL